MNTTLIKFRPSFVLLLFTMLLTPFVQGAAGLPESPVSCPSCPLPASAVGPLSGLLASNNDFLDAVNNCYAESLADIGSRCVWWNGVSPIVTTFNLNIPFAELMTNDVTDHCSHLYQIGTAALGTRPGNQWLMTQVLSINHLYGTTYSIQVEWRKYICPAPLPFRR